MSNAERLRRIVRAKKMEIGSADTLPALRVDLDFVFDPAWLSEAARHPGHAVTRGGIPVIAYVTPDSPDPARLIPIVQESTEIENVALRKRERPFMEKLTPDSVAALERASYKGSYKGVTDLLTKYLWPEWAFVLTRLSARIGLTPNMVTGIGALFCVIATVAFYYAWYWTGLACGLFFMILDTVDGKLARCTITSSKSGDILDHGMDLIHPPFWWYAWGAGLVIYGRPLSEDAFWLCMVAIVGGYVVQRLIEGAFIALFAIHIHVWRPFDSWFRLITARRNPNMPILAAFLLVGRPDWGLVAVAVWTIVSLVVHAVQLVQALIVRAQGRPVISWLA
jgi:phosphatidylglycerophosphate synthase